MGGGGCSHERIIGFSRGEDRAEGKRGRKVSEKKQYRRGMVKKRRRGGSLRRTDGIFMALINVSANR